MYEHTLCDLGWKPVHQQQLTDNESHNLLIVRVGAHLGSRLLCMSGSDEFFIPVSLTRACGELAVGDWVLLEPDTRRAVRRLERQSVLARKAAGERPHVQLIAANVDTLFIVSSCDHDFNPSRLERYLAFAAEAAVNPVVVLTKADLCDDPEQFGGLVAQLKRDVLIETLNARDPSEASVLSGWCQTGQTVAMVGSSGVGKSTLAMSLGVPDLATQSVRAADSKGRHTTTVRSLHRLASGGLLIDTPGMRELQLTACEGGVSEVFQEISQLAGACRFDDCSHRSEPGCAVQAAVAAGTLDARRVQNYLKLIAEQARNSKSLRQLRDDDRKRGRFYRSVQAARKELRSGTPRRPPA